MTSGLVNASFSLPEWQALKMIFFAPWKGRRKVGKAGERKKEGEPVIISFTTLDWIERVRKQLLLVTVLLLPLCYQARPKPVGRIAKIFFPRAKFTRQVFCSSALLCAGNLVNISSTQKLSWIPQFHAQWMPHVIFLSDRNDPLWECWYNLSNLTNQRVYQELVSPPSLSPVSFRFIFVFALSQFSRPDYLATLGAWNRLEQY